MRHSESLEDALHRWAMNEQGALTLGYPKSAAGFSEYRAPGYRSNARVLDQFEVDTLSLVERGISEMRKWPDRSPLLVLTEYYGAYPDANISPRPQRLAKVMESMSKRRMYDALKQARTYLQGIVDIYTADMH